MIDHSVHPDLDHAPDELSTPEERTDYVGRVCGAWDFGIVPTPKTFELFSGWREIFDRFPWLHSSAYTAFRTIFGWPRVPGGHTLEAPWERVDRRAGRTLPIPAPTASDAPATRGQTTAIGRQRSAPALRPAARRRIARRIVLLAAVHAVTPRGGCP